MEDYIKELKGGFGMEQMLSGDSLASALCFAQGVLVYNATIAQKYSLLPQQRTTKTAFMP